MPLTITLRIVFGKADGDNVILNIESPDMDLTLNDLKRSGGILDTAKPVLGVSSIKSCYYVYSRKTELE
ncbi:MAG: hypothetical protein IJ728_10760 [Selenomonadaceae bacterium]|nr:hypothetical protein [Selenomonadaceae bacterium]